MRERRDGLAWALGDAVVALAVLADAEGLSFDEVVGDRMAQLRRDRGAMLAGRGDRPGRQDRDDGGGAAEQPAPAKVPSLDDIQLEMFAEL